MRILTRMSEVLDGANVRQTRAHTTASAAVAWLAMAGLWAVNGSWPPAVGATMVAVVFGVMAVVGEGPSVPARERNWTWLITPAVGFALFFFGLFADGDLLSWIGLGVLALWLALEFWQGLRRQERRDASKPT